MQSKPAVLISLGLLTLTLSATTTVAARGRQEPEPIRYEVVPLQGDFPRLSGLTPTPPNLGRIQQVFDQEGKKGMRYLGSTDYQGTVGDSGHAGIGTAVIFASR